MGKVWTEGGLRGSGVGMTNDQDGGSPLVPGWSGDSGALGCGQALHEGLVRVCRTYRPQAAGPAVTRG